MFKAVVLLIVSGPLEFEFNQTETEERGHRTRWRLIHVWLLKYNTDALENCIMFVCVFPRDSQWRSSESVAAEVKRCGQTAAGQTMWATAAQTYTTIKSRPCVSYSDRPILIFITDTDINYLYVYVPDNRYSEPMFIYCYKVHNNRVKLWFFLLSVVLTTTKNCWK